MFCTLCKDAGPFKTRNNLLEIFGGSAVCVYFRAGLRYTPFSSDSPLAAAAAATVAAAAAVAGFLLPLETPQ